MTSTLGSSTANQTSDEASGSVAQAKDLAIEKTQEVRQKLGGQISDRVREQADQRATMAGEQASSIAEALRSTSSSLRDNGDEAPAKALDVVTEQVSSLGDYLTRSDGTRLLHDIEDMARKRPWTVAAGLFGIGFAASRVLSASSRERYGSRGTDGPTGNPYPGTIGATPVAHGQIGRTFTDTTGGGVGHGIDH